MQVKILVIDDDIEILNTINTIFTTLLKGYLVLNATTANSGLAMIKEQTPDIILVDVRLGPASGMDLIADYYSWINAKKGAYKPVFIVITAYDDEDVKKRAEEYKVDAFLMKPFAKEVILHAVIDGICKKMQQELSTLDTMRSHYKKTAEKLKNMDNKLDGK